MEGRVDLGFVHAFVASFSVIIVSELGDKTFFIAAIMAMRHMRFTVFGGAMGALALMTVLSGMSLVVDTCSVQTSVSQYMHLVHQQVLIDSTLSVSYYLYPIFPQTDSKSK